MPEFDGIKRTVRFFANDFIVGPVVVHDLDDVMDEFGITQADLDAMPDEDD